MILFHKQLTKYMNFEHEHNMLMKKSWNNVFLSMYGEL